MTHLFNTPTCLNSEAFILSARLRTLTRANLKRVSSFANYTIAIAMPAILSVFIAIYRKSIHEIHHGLLTLASGRFVALHEVSNPIVFTIHRTVSHLITEALKNRIGKYQNMTIDATYGCVYSRSTSPRLSCSVSVGPVRTYLHWVRMKVNFYRIIADEAQ
jgi:hypothetical protein